ncbi:MAG: hypothetical protein JF609_09570 [Verrucomicrobia bacterium]|nr:hypothetical protein [Verrucomicrobiota bacterium]
MKKKYVITIISIGLNVVLFSALAYCNKINARTDGATAPLILLQQLPDIGLLQGDGQGLALASAVK